MHYFSCSGGPNAVSIKSVMGQVRPNLCFLLPVGSAGHIVYSGASEVQNIDALFFMLEGDRCGFHKKHAGVHYAELVFLHPEGFAGQEVHSGRSMVRNANALFFMLGSDQCGSIKSVSRHVTPNFCFCIRRDLRVM
jgi:hypothetical protein